MALDSNGYPTTPMSTSTTSLPAGTTAARLAAASRTPDEYIDYYDVSEASSYVYTTLTNLGRLDSDGRLGAYNHLSEVGEKMVKPIDGYKVKHLEDEQAPTTFTLNQVGVNSATTGLTLDTNVGLIADMILRVPSTNELLKVTAVNANGTDITVIRAAGSVAAASIADDSVLEVLGTSVKPGQASVDPFNVVPAYQENFIQKIVTTMKTTDYDSFRDPLKSVGEKNMLIHKNYVEHIKQIEKFTLFGQKKALSADGSYTMDGVIELAKRGWTHDISGALTTNTLEDVFVEPLRYGSPKKIVFCGTKALSAVRDLFENRIQVEKIENTSMRFTSLETNNGTMLFVQHPFMDSQSGYAGHALILDPKYIRIAIPEGVNHADGSKMDGRTAIKENTSTSTYAQTVRDMVTYRSMILANARAHGLIKITNA